MGVPDASTFVSVASSLSVLVSLIVGVEGLNPLEAFVPLVRALLFRLLGGKLPERVELPSELLDQGGIFFSRHHQKALAKSIENHTKFIYVASQPDKWLSTEPARPTAASKRRKGPKKQKIEQPADKNVRIAVESHNNVRTTLLQFLNEHFTHENI